jgi:FkbM family methyltransferase
MSHFNRNWINEIVGQKDNLVIFDVGAYNFDDSIGFKNTFPKADVHAFEAFDFNFKVYGPRALQSGVKIHNVAISDKKGELTFYNSTDLNGMQWTCSGSILKPSAKEGVEIHPGLHYNKEGLKVPAMRLDEFCESKGIDHIDVIHMDVQGAEYYAIQGLGKLRPKILFCETCEFESYEGALTLEDLDNLLFSMGYEIKERLIYDTLYVLK